MTTSVFPYSEARIRLADLLRLAFKDGEVRLMSEEGKEFAIRPVIDDASPFDVPSANLGLSVQEIVSYVREGRERS